MTPARCTAPMHRFRNCKIDGKAGTEVPGDGKCHQDHQVLKSRFMIASLVLWKIIDDPHFEHCDSPHMLKCELLLNFRIVPLFQTYDVFTTSHLSHGQVFIQGGILPWMPWEMVRRCLHRSGLHRAVRSPVYLQVDRDWTIPLPADRDNGCSYVEKAAPARDRSRVAVPGWPALPGRYIHRTILPGSNLLAQGNGSYMAGSRWISIKVTKSILSIVSP